MSGIFLNLRTALATALMIAYPPLLHADVIGAESYTKAQDSSKNNLHNNIYTKQFSEIDSASKSNNDQNRPATNCLRRLNLPVSLGKFDHVPSIIGYKNNIYLDATFNICTGTWISNHSSLKISSIEYLHKRSSTSKTIAYTPKKDNAQDHYSISEGYSIANEFKKVKFFKGSLGFSDTQGNITISSEKYKNNNLEESASCVIATYLAVCGNDDDGTSCAPSIDSSGNIVRHEVEINICDKNWKTHYYSYPENLYITHRYLIYLPRKNKNSTSGIMHHDVIRNLPPKEKQLCLSKRIETIFYKGQMMETFPVPTEALTNSPSSSLKGNIPGDPGGTDSSVSSKEPPPTNDEIPAACYGK